MIKFIRIKYLHEVREPFDQAGEPGEVKTIDSRFGDRLIAQGYATLVSDESPNTTKGKVKSHGYSEPRADRQPEA